MKPGTSPVKINRSPSIALPIIITIAEGFGVYSGPLRKLLPVVVQEVFRCNYSVSCKMFPMASRPRVGPCATDGTLVIQPIGRVPRAGIPILSVRARTFVDSPIGQSDTGGRGRNTGNAFPDGWTPWRRLLRIYWFRFSWFSPENIDDGEFHRLPHLHFFWTTSRAMRLWPFIACSSVCHL